MRNEEVITIHISRRFVFWFLTVVLVVFALFTLMAAFSFVGHGSGSSGTGTRVPATKSSP